MKQAYFFGHDANMRRDPRIQAMLIKYGLEGYGRYWVIMEMMREQEDFCLDISGKYIHGVLAREWNCSEDSAKEFVQACTEEYELFRSDGTKLWSEDLNEKMAIMQEKSRKASAAARKRWDGPNVPHARTPIAGSPMRGQSNGTANAMQLNDTTGNDNTEHERTDSEDTENSVIGHCDKTQEGPAYAGVQTAMRTEQLRIPVMQSSAEARRYLAYGDL